MRTVPILVALGAFALCLLGSGRSHAGDGAPAAPAAPASKTLQGVPVRYAPPEDVFQAKTEAPAPGQWAVTYRSDDGRVFMQAMAFPVRPGQQGDHSRLLFQAVDVALRSINVQGFGLPGAEPLSIWGMNGAEAGVACRRAGGPAAGRARILRGSLTHWAFAWGVAPAKDAVGRSAVRAFVEGLRPQNPTFFAPHFFDPATRSDEILTPPGEAPVLREHLLGAARLTEMALGGPMSMARRAHLHQVLADDARAGTAKQREAFRISPTVFHASAGMDEAARQHAQWEIARAMHRTYVIRGTQAEPLALAFLEVYDAARKRQMGRGLEALRTRHIDTLLEVVGFLGSLAADRPRNISTREREAFSETVIQRWPTWSEAKQKTMREIPWTWLRLRYLWDQASPAMQVAFRLKLLSTLAVDGQQTAVAGLRTPMDLRHWHDSHPPSRPLEEVLGQLLETDDETWTAWLTALGDPQARVPLGW